MPWDFALILFVLGVIVPWRGTVKIRRLLARPQLDSSERLTLYASTIAFQWVAAALVMWRSMARGIKLERLGLATPQPLFLALVTAALCTLLVGNQYLGLRRMARHRATREGFLYRMTRALMPQNPVESLAFVALVSTVALCEELIYRGFALTAFEDALDGGALLGALLSSALFALAHLYQGRRGVISTFFVGGLFAAVRLWTGSLAPSILAHGLADLVAGLAAPRLLTTAHLDDSPAAGAISSGGPKRNPGVE